MRHLRTVDASALACGHPDPDVRQEALALMVATGGRRAVRTLVRALGDAHPAVRLAAARALEQVGEGALAQAVLAVIEGDVEAPSRFRDGRAVKPLVRLLASRDGHVRTAATHSLVLLGKMAVPPLIRALRRGPLEARVEAAEALGKIGDAAALGPLLRALRRPEARLRCAAADSLGCLGHPAATGPLVRALDDGDSQVRVAAAKALGRLQPPATECLVRALEHPQTDVREAAARALVGIGAAAVPALAAVLEHPLPVVRAAAAWALGELAPLAAAAIPALRRRARAEPDAAVRQVLGRALRCLQEALRQAPSELQASLPPGGTGKELLAADCQALPTNENGLPKGEAMPYNELESKGEHSGHCRRRQGGAVGVGPSEPLRPGDG